MRSGIRTLIKPPQLERHRSGRDLAFNAQYSLGVVVNADSTDVQRHIADFIELNNSMRVIARLSPVQESGCAVAVGGVCRFRR